MKLLPILFACFVQLFLSRSDSAELSPPVPDEFAAHVTKSATHKFQPQLLSQSSPPNANQWVRHTHTITRHVHEQNSHAHTMEATMGMKSVVVATLLVNCVMMVEVSPSTMTSSTSGRSPNTVSWSPIHWDSPDSCGERRTPWKHAPVKLLIGTV